MLQLSTAVLVPGVHSLNLSLSEINSQLEGGLHSVGSLSYPICGISWLLAEWSEANELLIPVSWERDPTPGSFMELSKFQSSVL